MDRFTTKPKPSPALEAPLSGAATSLGSLAFSELTIGPAIGAGSYGTVFRGSYRGEEVAIKCIALRALQAQSLERYLHSELAALQALRHPSLIRYLGSAQQGDTLHIVCEYMAGGALSGVLGPALPPLPWRLRVALGLAAAEGLACLHSSDMLHRDIKTENLLLDDAWRLVIADYGFAKRVAHLKGGPPQAGTILGTESFMAPEVQFGEAYGEKADVFSLGCVLAELLTGLAPGAPGFLERTPRNKFAADLQQLRQAAPPDAPPSLVECICQCLAYDPEARLASDDVVAWLRDLLAELPECSLQDLPLPSQLQRQRAAAAAAAAAGSAGGSSAGGGAGEAAAGEAAEAGAEAAAEGSGAAEGCGKGR